MVRDKGARLKSERNLWALKYCTMNIASVKNEVVSGLLIRNILISLAWVGEVVQRVYTCGLVRQT